jgi:ABC-type sulfate transport system permease component
VTSPDRDASVALAGFLCGLCSFIASAVASLNFIAGLFLTFIGRSGAEPGLSIGEVVVLLIAAFPVALVGLILSVRGRHSSSRRRLARSGMIFSCLALVPFFVAVVALSLTVSYCSMHSCI